MKPPAPGPVSGDSAANDISTQAAAASTAFPPARSASSPARAVSGCPAATTPFMFGKLAPGNELGHVDLGEAPRARAPHARLVVGCQALVARLAAWRGPVLGPSAVARGDHRHPDLVDHLLVDHRAEDDVRLGVRGLGHRLGGLVDLP